LKNHKLLTIFMALAFVFVLTGVSQQKSDDTAIDPVCGMTVKKAEAKATSEYKGTTYYFCNPGCKDSFAKDPEKFLKKQETEGKTGLMHGRMMQHGTAGLAGGCPMMQGKAGEAKGCCGMMGMGMMGHGMKAAGGSADCPMMAKDVEKKVENTADGVAIKITSKNPETVKKIQEHVAKMGEGCAMMKGCCEKPAAAEEKK